MGGGGNQHNGLEVWGVMEERYTIGCDFGTLSMRAVLVRLSPRKPLTIPMASSPASCRRVGSPFLGRAGPFRIRTITCRPWSTVYRR